MLTIPADVDTYYQNNELFNNILSLIYRIFEYHGYEELRDRTGLVFVHKTTIWGGQAIWTPAANHGYIELAMTRWPNHSCMLKNKIIRHEACHIVQFASLGLAPILDNNRNAHNGHWRCLMDCCGHITHNFEENV